MKSNSFPHLSSYVGYIAERDMSREYFSNTCLLDYWMTYFKIMQEQYPEQLENIIKENSIGANSMIAVFLGFIRHNPRDLLLF